MHMIQSLGMWMSPMVVLPAKSNYKLLFKNFVEEISTKTGTLNIYLFGWNLQFFHTITASQSYGKVLGIPEFMAHWKDKRLCKRLILSGVVLLLIPVKVILFCSQANI